MYFYLLVVLGPPPVYKMEQYVEDVISEVQKRVGTLLEQKYSVISIYTRPKESSEEVDEH